MSTIRNHGPRAWALLAALLAMAGLTHPRAAQDQGGFRFKSGVELINVTATVTDRSGRFASNLRKDDFLIYEDNKPVEVTHFSADRTPVSLGIVVDTSGSMQGEKWSAAYGAIDRFLQAHVGRARRILSISLQRQRGPCLDWTDDYRGLRMSSLGRVHPNGGTAMYDAAAEAVPMAQSGKNRKKAIVIISDGNDTSSRVGVGEVRRSLGKPRCSSTRLGLMAMATPRYEPAAPPIVAGRACRFRFRSPGRCGGRGGGELPPPPIPVPGRWWRRCYDPASATSQRDRAAADDATTAEVARRSSRPAGSRSGQAEYCRRAQQAVRYRVPESRVQGRSVAHDSGRGPRPFAEDARAASTSRLHDGIVTPRWHARWQWLKGVWEVPIMRRR